MSNCAPVQKYLRLDFSFKENNNRSNEREMISGEEVTKWFCVAFESMIRAWFLPCQNILNYQL